MFGAFSPIFRRWVKYNKSDSEMSGVEEDENEKEVKASVMDSGKHSITTLSVEDKRSELERNRSRSFGSRESQKKTKNPFLSHQTSEKSLDEKKMKEREKTDNLLRILQVTRRLSSSSRSDPDLLKQPEPAVRGRAHTTETQISLANKFRLMPEQHKTLCQSWAKLTDIKQPRGAILLMERVFANLCIANREINAIFIRSACMKGMEGKQAGMASKNDHAKFLLCLTGDIVKSLDKDGKDMVETLRDIGDKHSKLKLLGFEEECWDKFGDTFVELISLSECARKQHETTKTWALLVAAIVDRMKAGFRKKKRIQKQQAVSSTATVPQVNVSSEL